MDGPCNVGSPSEGFMKDTRKGRCWETIDFGKCMYNSKQLNFSSFSLNLSSTNSLLEMSTDVIYHHYLWPFLCWTVPQPALKLFALTTPLYFSQKLSNKVLPYSEKLEISLSPTMWVTEKEMRLKTLPLVKFKTKDNTSDIEVRAFFGISPLFESDRNRYWNCREGEWGMTCNNGPWPESRTRLYHLVTLCVQGTDFETHDQCQELRKCSVFI